MLVTIVLYGINLSGASLQSKLEVVLKDIGYFSTKEVPDVCI